MTAHARKAQQYMSPSRNPLAGQPTAVDATSYANNMFKEIQKYTRPLSAVIGGVGGTGMDETTGRSSYSDDAWLLAQFKGVDMQPSMARPREAILLGPGMSELPKPVIPTDAKFLQSPAPFKELATKQRNRFNLMGAPDSKASAKINNVGHFSVDSWEMQAQLDAKQHTQGPRDHKPHVPVRDFKGAGLEDQTLAATLKYQKNSSAATVPPRFGPGKDNFMGVKAKIPVDDRLLSSYKAQKQAIVDANAPQDLPFRGMPIESKLNDHYKQSNELAADAVRVHDRVLSPASKLKVAWTPSPSKQLSLTDAEVDLIDPDIARSLQDAMESVADDPEAIALLQAMAKEHAEAAASDISAAAPGAAPAMAPAPAVAAAPGAETPANPNPAENPMAC